MKKCVSKNMWLCLSFLVLLQCCTSSNTVPRKAKVAVQKEGSKYTLIRNGRLFSIRGAAGFTHLKELREMGGNTIRVYDTVHLAEILDSAYKHDVAVIAGLPMPKSKFIEFYDDQKNVNKMYQGFERLVERNKNHPALLMWALGNELRFPNRLKYNNFYKAFNGLAAMIRKKDPNHPITTTIENLKVSDVFNIRVRTKDVDIISINTFSALPRLKRDLNTYSWLWNGPFIVSEWGIPGTWEEKRTSWGAPIEKTSTEKAVYLKKYHEFLPEGDPRFLGSLVFYWGAKQERTHTWYNMFSEEGLLSEPLAAMATIWSKKTVLNRAPKVEKITLNGKAGQDNLIYKSGIRLNASVRMRDPDKDAIEYKWEVLPEDWYDVNDNQVKKPSPVQINRSSNYLFSFDTPKKEGPYRVFVTAYDHQGNFATANIPFYVMN